jgi:hypothetical protein
MKTKKELKQAYKQHKPIMGVFQVKNETNGKVLIEGSTDVQARWNRHLTELRFGSHRNPQLQKDWNEAVSEDFTFTILSTLEYLEGKNVDYAQEVKTLEEIVVEELGLEEWMRY